MAQGVALEKIQGFAADDTVAPASVAAVRVTHSLAEVEPIWRALTAQTVQSPGQQFDFVRLWIAAQGIVPADCVFIVAEADGLPLAVVPLHRRWDKGVRVLSWFPGSHVGCNAPIVDVAKLAAMSSVQRRMLWIDMLRGIKGADAVHMRSVPQMLVDGVDLFAELGQSTDADILYRAEFSSFEDADKTQRNKSRRKHDRQQGDKLEAMGAVTFEEIGNGPAALGAIDTMFRQRAARFREMGVFDPFAVPAIRTFYDSLVADGSGVPVKLHLLRLDGEIVAMRYNIVHGDRLFCLISSMSEDAALRPGSPGKQCLLRVMQTMFAAGYSVFDMGEGETDEKRHWCNVQIPVRHHYVPITRRGALAVAAHRGLHGARARIKADPRLLELAKRARGMMLKLSGKGGAPAPAPIADAE